MMIQRSDILFNILYSLLYVDPVCSFMEGVHGGGQG